MRRQAGIFRIVGPAVALILPLVGCRPQTAPAARTAGAAKPAEPARLPIVLNLDDNAFQNTRSADQMTEEGCIAYFNRMCCGANTHFFLNMQCATAVYDSKAMSPCWHEDPRVTTMAGERWYDNTLLLEKRGVDRAKIWFRLCRERGISPWISMRMNDIHSITQPKNAWRSKFWLDHPEFRRVPGSEGKGGWKSAALNYEHPEVRAYMLGIAREILEKWDSDGIELDWMRFAHHVSPQAESNRTGHVAITAFMRDMRRLVDEVGRKRGRRLLIAARVPTRPENAFVFGHDTETWAREGLVDWIIAAPFLDWIDYGLPCAAWKKRLQALKPDLRFLVGLDNCGMTRDWKHWRPSRAEACAYFERMFAEGAEGFYFFNYFDYNEKSKWEVWSSSRLIQKEGFDAKKVIAEARSYPVSCVDCVPLGEMQRPFPDTAKSRSRTYRVVAGSVGTASSAAVRIFSTDPLTDKSVASVRLNGRTARSIRTAEGNPVYPEMGVYDYDFPVSALREGTNEIVLSPSSEFSSLQGVSLELGAAENPTGGRK